LEKRNVFRIAKKTSGEMRNYVRDCGAARLHRYAKHCGQAAARPFDYRSGQACVATTRQESFNSGFI
jgi:hypothetical protein